MVGALILLAALFAVGIVLRVTHRPDVEDDGAGVAAEKTLGDGHGPFCCGMHVVCEKGLDRDDTAGDYYDDDELDEYKGREADDYTDAETEQFRDVLLTLRVEELAGWAMGLERRGVALPAIVREELLMIVGEAREAMSMSKTMK